MGNKNWETPPWFFELLNAEFKFTLDAAASHDNKLADLYCTPDGTYEDLGNGPPHLLETADGLQFSWDGQRVFCNPPYDHTIPQWIKKAQKREAKLAVLLLPANVDTQWFHELLWSEVQGGSIERSRSGWRVDWNGLSIPAGRLLQRDELLIHKGRLRFYLNGKPSDAPRYGNLLYIVHG